MTHIIIILVTMLTGYTQPFSVEQYLSAIVETGHGNELHWYTPRVEYYLPHGVPSTVKGATNCWPPVYSGRVYVNPRLTEVEAQATIVHELVHLANNCHGSEYDTEMAAMDAMAYLGMTDAVIVNLIAKMQGRDDLPRYIEMEYYTRPAYTMLFGDITNYTYLYRMLEYIGIREREYGGKK